MSDSRLEQLKQWLTTVTEQTYSNIHPASADASFRRYFRVSGDHDKQSYIVMDAPPEQEDCLPFIHITELIRSSEVNSPEVIAQDLESGFLLLSDLGTQCYLEKLDSAHADTLYSDAIDALLKMQTIEANLPAYDAKRLGDEMNLFETWYLNKHLETTMSIDDKKSLYLTFDLLIDNAHKQPQVFVHRDYHSRNLMVLENNNPGVIDFQDAVIGPVTYDLVSLFKDCYIQWPREQVEGWVKEYLLKSGLDVEPDDFLKWFDLMGVQRHIKVLGIFCRLYYRDQKAQYLDDLPLTLNYLIDTCKRYDELQPLLTLFKTHVLDHEKISGLTH